MNDDAAREAAFARAYRTARITIERTTKSGQRLLVGDLTRATGLSPTPVREALSRLVGEGMIEEHRGGGYFVPRVDAGDIVEFYALARTLALGAIAARATGSRAHRTRHLAAVQASPPDTLEARTSYWFERIAIASGNRLLAAEMRRLNGRMAGIRRAEAAVMTGLATWLDAISSVVETDDADGQSRWVQRYCRAGTDKAWEIADWLSA